MPSYPQLVHLSVPELIGAAGGDPWRIDDTIQAGAPGEISELATSFRNAGLCITETDEEFYQAKKRFDQAWDRDDPAHPVNDSEEVRRATQWLRLGPRQMAKVAADLQDIAADLAEAQRSGRISIGNLEAQLKQIDDLIDSELQEAAAAGQQLDWSELKKAAVDATKQALGEMNALRNAYGAKLNAAQLEMAADGYDTDAIDGGVPKTPAPQPNGRPDSQPGNLDDALNHDRRRPSARRRAAEASADGSEERRELQGDGPGHAATEGRATRPDRIAAERNSHQSPAGSGSELPGPGTAASATAGLRRRVRRPLVFHRARHQEPARPRRPRRTRRRRVLDWAAEGHRRNRSQPGRCGGRGDQERPVIALPAYYLGEKTFDVGSTAAALSFGGEGAAVRAGLPVRTIAEGGAPEGLVRGWHPTGGMPWEEFGPQFGTPGSRIWPENNGFPAGYEPQPAQLPRGPSSTGSAAKGANTSHRMARCSRIAR